MGQWMRNNWEQALPHWKQYNGHELSLQCENVDWELAPTSKLQSDNIHIGMREAGHGKYRAGRSLREVGTSDERY